MAGNLDALDFEPPCDSVGCSWPARWGMEFDGCSTCGAEPVWTLLCNMHGLSAVRTKSMVALGCTTPRALRTWKDLKDEQ